MTKSDLIDEVWANNRDLPYMKVKGIVERVFSTIEDELLSGGKVVVNGFGTFEIREHASRRILNPRTGEEMITPASKYPALKAGKNFKKRIVKQGLA